MSPALLWSNLLAYSAQVLVIVAVGALLPLIFRVRHLRFQLIWCQLLLVGCLLLPVLQPWHRTLFFVPQSAPPPAVGISPVKPPPPAERYVPLEEVALLVLAAGVSLRVLWLFMGLWRLRRYRTEATRLDALPPALEAARTRTGSDASIYVSEAIEGPVTFGVLSPVILVPPAILEQAGGHQFAIACHEFVHVRRRDWLFTVCEEFAGALLWFHPAVWWLLSQIRLSREQVVDRDVVALMESRDRYVDALLAIAAAHSRLDLAPAPLFLRKRHLKQRIRSLFKEVSVSKRRLVSSYLTFTVVLLLTAWVAATAFPLRSTWDSLVYTGIPKVPYPGGLGGSDVKLIKVIPRGMIGGVVASRPVAFVGTQLRPTGTLDPIDLSRLPEPLRTTMRSRLAPFENQPVSTELIRRVNEAASEVDGRVQLTWFLPVEVSSQGNPKVSLSLYEGVPPPAGVPVKMITVIPRRHVSSPASAPEVIEAPPRSPPPVFDLPVETIGFEGISDELRERIVSKLSLRVGIIFTREARDKAWRELKSVDNSLSF